MPRWLFWIAIALLAVPLYGCETKRVWVELPSFGDGTIDGVWLWRRATTGEYERQCRIPFGPVEIVQNAEAVPYGQECGDETFDWDLHATLERSPSNPTAVKVGLWYMRWEDPGTYKISAYGPDGESALSDTTLEL